MDSNRIIPVVEVDSADGRALLKRIIEARSARNRQVERIAARVIADIARQGDRALCAYTRKFEGRALDARTIRIPPSHIEQQARRIAAPLARTIDNAIRRIRAYHRPQGLRSYRLVTAEGVVSQRIVPLNRVGIYVPGGRSPYPSSVLMNVIPAQIAGVREIAVVTPCAGDLDPAIAYALQRLGVGELYRIGGCQAVAALALGTRSIPAVDKIVGPGNAYVAAAKRLVFGMVDIDSIAGPSEVVILADDRAPEQWIALDMLAQAEHGSGDETAICITENAAFARRIAACCAAEIARSPSQPIFSRLSPQALCIFISKSRGQSIEFVNSLAPEHLQIMTRTCRRDAAAVKNSGAIFIGPYTPVALGDYYIGTNHVLPTGGSARFSSGLGVDDFQKRISVAEVSRRGLRTAAPHVSRFARAERFHHHALSVERRSRSAV